MRGRPGSATGSDAELVVHCPEAENQLPSVGRACNSLHAEGTGYEFVSAARLGGGGVGV